MIARPAPTLNSVVQTMNATRETKNRPTRLARFRPTLCNMVVRRSVSSTPLR